ncbi:GerMN domain-containing protein [Bacillus sp. Marseille-P3661]|uniref:GerMN domain-containing protein n=1 Tax=Bacillus sp. Marseille-P3661 TaxID=1936234 RepID=UPI000C860E91|nr:hypothetical protein [Bacillus sp. Marseille-P3661]
MGKSTFDEKQLEELLKNMPRITDRQDPDELFARISSRLQEEELADEVKSKKTLTKRKPWILPVIASIAAIILIALVSPSFLYNQESSMEKTGIERNNDTASQSTVEPDLPQEQFGIMSAEENMGMLRMAPPESRVINVANDNEEVITIALPDKNAQFVVPISFQIPKDDTSRLSKVENIYEYLHEDEWGLSSYILTNTSLAEEEVSGGIKKVILDVPADHPYGNGSAMENIFLATIKETFSQLDYDLVELRTAGQPGIMLGNYGEIKELQIDNEEEKDAYFIYQPFESNYIYLVPLKQTVDNFKQAIETMKVPVEIDSQLRPAISDDINFENVETDDSTNTATVEFSSGSQLKNDVNDILMIEAILMTAKEYGYTNVEFKNSPADSIGPYLLTEPIQVPLAVNPMPYVR